MTVLGVAVVVTGEVVTGACVTGTAVVGGVDVGATTVVVGAPGATGGVVVAEGEVVAEPVATDVVV